MNITALARMLKITPQELRNNLPALGYDIGQKAIKINNNVANKIIKDWPRLRKQLAYQKRKAEEEAEKKLKKEKTIDKVEIPGVITVKEFATMLDEPINAVLAILMKSGIFASLNEKIDFDTAWLVGSELGVEVAQKEAGATGGAKEDNKLKNILAGENKEKMLDRPPVIVVMGHVDHGKTKLLDAIRRSHVVEGEAGGITQHIGAYQVTRKKQIITFIDTPGHEAFTAMRSRGAKIADIAILVVAADDGVKPQTIEAFRIIEAAKIPFVVAINKIDKPEANIDKTKQELSSQLNIIPEDWGGKHICVPVSALKKEGIDDILDMVLLVAETEADHIKANPESSAVGTIIESHINKGAGPVATLLIQNGSIRVGDSLVFNNVNIGKVRKLNNYKGESIDFGGPATPVQIIGLKNLPQVGDIVEVGTGEKIKTKKIKGIAKIQSQISAKKSEDEGRSSKKINLIIRSDVLGSAEAIEESLEKINTKEISVKIIHKSLGNITEGDVKKAEAVNAIIIGFNVKAPANIEELARNSNVEIKLYSIIYDLINEIKAKMQEMIDPIITRQEIGKLKVLAVFKTEKNKQIIGGKVLDGIIENSSIIEVTRNNEAIAEGKISKLQSGKQDVNSVDKDQECGIEYEGNPIIQIGDELIIYKEEKTVSRL